MKKQSTPEERPVRVKAGAVELEGSLCLPENAPGIVIFAHGSGSSRLSPRNQYVARELRTAGLGTLLFDLLTKKEEETDLFTAELRFDIGLLADRLIGATDWLTGDRGAEKCNIGYFGASTGAAAALTAAAERPDVIKAVVSRGGRPDLAGEALPRVKAPTLLIVGGNDTPVIAMNRDAMRYLKVETKLEIIPRATHLFEETGALEKVTHLASDWFGKYLKQRHD